VPYDDGIVLLQSRGKPLILDNKLANAVTFSRASDTEKICLTVKSFLQFRKNNEDVNSLQNAQIEQINLYGGFIL